MLFVPTLLATIVAIKARGRRRLLEVNLFNVLIRGISLDFSLEIVFYTNNGKIHREIAKIIDRSRSSALGVYRNIFRLRTLENSFAEFCMLRSIR